MTELQYTGPGVVLRFGELFLKGGNRFRFEEALEQNVRRAVGDRNDVKVVRKHGRIFALGASDSNLLNRLADVFGIASVSPAVFCKKNLEEITKNALEQAELRPADTKTFRISARRSDKGFPLTSTEIGRQVGAAVADTTGLGVDLENYDLAIGVEVGLDWTFVWSSKQPGAGGLPAGTAGKGMLLLSGGIDSPVAGHMMQKRGLELSAVYYHAFPYTGDGAKDKVIRLAELLAKRQKSLTLSVVPFTAVQELFRDQAPGPYLVILYRRAMIRIAEMIAKKTAVPVLVTGEALGQVASQTLTNLSAIENAAGLPILRPLVGFDKAEVITLARRIGSFDISIEPYDDCCSLFVPKHPETKAYLPQVHSIERKIDWQPRVEEAFANTETLR
ncbi:MAG: tRNA 4-thiouridine(8) synthase ThiI, partial [Proteobacteria bacterium]|nr:tRNA 4-thiouridine(8) synthase ThiI [Pseudomonadota bacterium]